MSSFTTGSKDVVSSMRDVVNSVVLVLGRAASRGAKVLEDAADDAALGDEGDHPHHAPDRGGRRADRSHTPGE